MPIRTFEERKAINYLLMYTNYTNEVINEWNGVQIISTYKRVESDIKRYKNEILDFLSLHEVVQKFISLDYVKGLSNYHELASLRKELGLDKRTKVYKIVSNPVVEEKLEYGENKQVNIFDYFGESIMPNFEDGDSKKLQSISYKNARKLFGLMIDTLDEDELKKKGYVLSDNKEIFLKKLNRDLKDEMIIVLLSNSYTDENGDLCSYGDLIIKSMDEIRAIYNVFIVDVSTVEYDYDGLVLKLSYGNK